MQYRFVCTQHCTMDFGLFPSEKTNEKKKKMVKFHFCSNQNIKKKFTYNDSAINRIHIVFVQINLLENDVYEHLESQFWNCLSLTTPIRTSVGGRFFVIQCAAVITHCSEIRLPPQSKSMPPSSLGYPNAACNQLSDQWNSCEHFSIFFNLLTMCGYSVRLAGRPNKILSDVNGIAIFEYFWHASTIFSPVKRFGSVLNVSSVVLGISLGPVLNDMKIKQNKTKEKKRRHKSRP